MSSGGGGRAHDGDGGTSDAVGELRALALLALDRLDPVLTRLRAAAADPAGTPEGGASGGAGSCPVCAVLAVLRGGRAEQGHLTEHAAELLVALRAALTGPPADPAPVTPDPAVPRRVQHVPVERAGAPRSARVVQRVVIDRPESRAADRGAAVGGPSC